MERRVKERLAGAAILVMLGVIFIPMILDDSVHTDTTIEETNIPERPPGKFDSRNAPLEEPEPQSMPEPEPQPAVTPEEKPAQDKAEPEPKPEPEPELKPEPKPEPKPEAKPQPPVEKQTADNAEQQTEVKKAPASDQQARGLPAWVVQLGSFSKEGNARGLIAELQKSGYPAFVEPLKKGSEIIYRVRVGPELLRSDANTLKDKLKKETGMEGIVLEYP